MHERKIKISAFIKISGIGEGIVKKKKKKLKFPWHDIKIMFVYEAFI